jgi:predicted RNA-binding protein with PUA-like domain
VKEAYPDCKLSKINSNERIIDYFSLKLDTAFDESHPYYDPKSNKDNPRWFMVKKNKIKLTKLQNFINNVLSILTI